MENWEKISAFDAKIALSGFTITAVEHQNNGAIHLYSSYFSLAYTPYGASTDPQITTIFQP